MDAILQKFGELISNNFALGMVIAFIAGILTVFTPCSLSSIPLIVAYVGGAGVKKAKAVDAENAEGDNDTLDNIVEDVTIEDSVETIKTQRKKAFLLNFYLFWSNNCFCHSRFDCSILRKADGYRRIRQNMERNIDRAYGLDGT